MRIYYYSIWLIKVKLAIVRRSYRMTRRFFTLFAPLFVLFWIAGTNHCAIEYILSEHTESAQSNCSSHPSKSPEGHAEGFPCSSKSLVTVRDGFFAKVKDNLGIVILSYFLVEVGSLESNIFISRARNPKDVEPESYEEGVLDSLSIAPNAPPITA